MTVEGVKHDAGKLRYDLIPHDALKAYVGVLTYGANKYTRRHVVEGVEVTVPGARNWELGMDWSRLYAAALRHLTSWWQGGDADPESGHPPLAHALCCISFLLAYQLRKKGTDDRPCPA